MSSTRTDSRFRYSNSRDPSLSPRSQPRERSTSSKSFEPERFKKRQEYQNSNHQDEDKELCMKKLSEFNESLRRQGQSVSTKFQWNHILLNSPGKAAALPVATVATMPEIAMQNEIAAPTYSMSPMGIGLSKENRFIEPRPLHLKSDFVNNGENFPYPNAGNRGMLGEAVDFGVYGENLGFDSTSAISVMAWNRIRKTEELTEFAHRKMESLARASTVDSIIDKIDGAGQNWEAELDSRVSSSQQYMNEQERKILHGGRYQQGENCSPHDLTQRYDFSAQREDVMGVGIRMEHTQSQASRGALFYGERQRLGELGIHISPPLYPDLNEKPDRNEKAVFLGESHQFQHSLAGKSHEMEHQNELCGTRRDCHLSPKKTLTHGAWQEELRNDFNFGRKSHVKEQATDVSGSWMNPRLDQKRVVLNGGRFELSEDYGHSLARRHLDFNVVLHEKHQENEEILGSGMNHLHKQKRAPFLGEKQQKEETEVMASRMNRHQPQEQKGDSLHGESQQLLRECALESYPLPKQDENVYTTELLVSRMNRHQPQEQKGVSLHVESQQLLRDCESYPLVKQDDNVYTTEASRMNCHQPQEHKGASLHFESQQLLQVCESYPLAKLDDNVYTTEVLASRMNRHQPQEQKGPSLHVQSQQLLRDCESYPLPKHDDNVCTTEGGSGTPLISATEESGINSQSSKSHSKKRIIDLRKIRESQIGRLTQISGASDDEILDMEHAGEQLNDEEKDIVFDELSSNKKNIKQRLGPSCQIHNPYPSNRKSVKQRLGPPCQVHNPKIKKRLKENVYDHFQELVKVQDVDIPDVKRGRTEPREDTEEFKLLIHVCSVKFFKVLNENSAQRRKYTETGDAGTLKCCVCGSKSKEFANTICLATHAFLSLGRRVDHLGFHKALCLLMGWNSMATSNNVWIPKALPDAEALAMKEDLVVWPPTVILHNSSITTANPDDRVIVSIEELEAFIKGMGFGREISKVCRGKPANQSIMTVIFHGTFSGLLKAEKLHKLYSDNKHGRAEFQQINCNTGQPLQVPTNKVEDVLYGYLGIASDLDKLDFETKSHSTVKSKKEIYAIAGAPLNNEKLGSY